MSSPTKQKMTGIAALILIVLAVTAYAVQQRREQPPEAKEYLAAIRIEDKIARIKELERILAAYPETRYRATMEMAIVNTRIEMCTGVEAALELQKAVLKEEEGMARLSSLNRNAGQILDHENLAGFDKKKTAEALFAYVREGRKLAADPSFVERISQDERPYLSNVVSALILTEARVHVFAGNHEGAAAALEAYDQATGPKNAGYHYLGAEVLSGTGKKGEAVDAFLRAAADSPRGFTSDAADRAKALHLETGGTATGFETKLEKMFRELPFHPEPFAPAREWKGKAVLLELFTGSECPPCVGADLGFDGILEAYDPKYAAVLEYHLPIPGPDPMMNPATGRRQALYGVNSTPTVVIDGESRQSYIGGGNRGMAETKFNFYASEIATRVYDEPVVGVTASATLSGDSVRVDFSASGVPSGSDIHVALVQKEERYRGSNGLLFHKMVVREIRTAAPGEKRISIGLTEIEKAADAYLTDFENNYSRVPGFRFPERKFKIGRDELCAVVFVQDQATKKVWNAAVADVQKR